MRRNVAIVLAGFVLYALYRQSRAATGAVTASYFDILPATWADITGSGSAVNSGSIIDSAAQAVITTGQNIMTGATRGERNNNPGNIVKSSAAWEGKIAGNDSRFETFVDPVYGIRALSKLLGNYMTQGYNTVNTIINHYAPPTENDTGAYVRSVASYVGVDPNATLDTSAIPALTYAIIKHENGRVVYTPEQLAQGYQMAGFA